MTLPPALILSLDILGITLALLDFTGAARRVEERLRYIAKRQKKRARIYRRWIFKFGGWKTFMKDLLRFSITAPATALIGIGIIHVFDLWNGFFVLLGYFPEIPSLSWWQITLVIILFPVIWAGIFTLNSVSGALVLVGLLVVFHRVFWLLSLPRAGIIGTIGLLLPLTTMTLNALTLA